MTEKEAIDYFNNVTIDIRIGTENIAKTSDLINVCIEALEKQIPQAVVNKTKPDNGVATKYENCHIVICPACKGRLKLKSKGNYCDKCGQALEW